MSEKVISPDLEFVNAVVNSGGESLKKCFQCATCSVVCNVTPDDSPFPRKEMVQAQFGMKDKLVAGLDSWLCIHCNDCSTHCPRGANPGDVMAVIRSKAVQHFSTPGFIARAANTPR